MTEPNQSSSELLSTETTANVNFSHPARREKPVLPIPNKRDNLETIACKMDALRRVIEHGQSLAVQTGYQGTAQQERDPEAIARKDMTPPELMQYNQWRNGASMPDIDWTQARKEISNGNSARTRMALRAEAMRKIWKNDNIDAENASWLTSEMVHGLPLVKAVVRIANARRHLLGGQDGLTEMELAEVQTCRKVLAIVTGQMNRSPKQQDRIVKKRINAAMSLIQTRQHAIKSRMRKSKAK